MDRRAFVRGVATAIPIVTLPALPGCVASGGSRFAGNVAHLPRVRVDESRLIRTAVGLRPYRDGGFVVRRDAFADTRLVHNYGHGGSGITLSWGTSKLAVDLGLAGHTGPVAVLGAGVIGLSTARLAQEAGFAVTIYAASLPPETTSNIAGGQWHPFGHFRDSVVTDQWREQFRAAADYSWRRFQIMVGADYGVRWLTTYSEGEPERPLLSTFPPAQRALSSGEHPFAIEQVFRFDTLYVEPGRYLRQLMRDVLQAGGRFEVRRFDGLPDIAALRERLVFNCTGLGARALFGDMELRPARGQLAILLPQPEVEYAYTFNAGYMFPRPDGIVLGGTFALDNWALETDPRVTARILASHRELRGDTPKEP